MVWRYLWSQRVGASEFTQVNLPHFITHSKVKGQVGTITDQYKNIWNKHSHGFEELRFRKAKAFAPVHTARKESTEIDFARVARKAFLSMPVPFSHF